MKKILTLIFTFTTFFISGQTIISNSFDNSSDWIIGTPNLQGQWQVQATTTADLTQYLGAMASTSASNGFGVFNAIQYLFNGPVNDQDATLELNNTIDLTNYPAVLIEFEQRYRKFNYDETFIEFSTDNGTTWPSSLAIPLNTQVNTNDPAIQELVAINISSFVGGQSSVRVRFRWKSISSASANPNGFGSGYGWMVDDLKVTVPNSNDLQNLSSWIFGELSSGAEYGRTPISQVEPNYYVGASVYNFGSTAQNNVVVDGDFNGPTSFTTTASIASIPSDSTERIESLEPMNFAVGVYNGTFTVTSDSDQVGGPNFGDNIQLRNFEITNDVYSLDGIGNHPVGTEILGSIGTTSFTGAEDGLICATMFPFYANDTINSVKVLIDTSNSSAGAEVILRIIDSTSFRDQLFNNAIFTSNLYVVTASDIAQGFIEIPVGNISSNGLLFESLPIPAGNYYIAIEMFSFTNVYDIAIVDDKTVGQPDWSSAIFFPNDQNYPNGNAFAIRLNLGDNTISTFVVVNDLAVVSANVASGCDLTATEPIEIWVVNQGSVADSAFNLSYSVNGGTTIFETINSYLNPGDTLKYVFTTTADMSADGIYDIDFECLLAVDADTTDNYFNFVAENYVTPADAITIGDTICIGDTAYISAVGFGYITWHDAATGGNEIGDDEDLIVTPYATTSYYAQVEAIEEFDDDFESYSDGDLIAQSSIDWNTWSGTTGAGDDAEVTNAQASSSSNSLYLNNADGDDIVLPFGRAFSTGYFAYSMDMYIVTDAYFNFQSDVTIGIGWAFDVYLSGGIIDVQIGGLTYLTGSYPTGSPIWFNIEFKGDLDNDTLELFTNGNSQGAFQITSPLAAVNIYANTGNEYYIDNVEWGAYGGNACRSISRTEAIVSVNNQSISTDSYTACDSLTWINGITYYSSVASTEIDTLQSISGCDSIVTLELTINNSSAITIPSTACDTFTWDGVTYDSTGTYTKTYSGANTCDSVVTLELTINKVVPDFSESNSLFTAPPFSVQFTNTTPNLSNYNFTWDFGDSTFVQSNNSSVFHQYMYNGLYDVKLIAEDIANGCGNDTLKKDGLIFCSGGPGLSINEKTSLVNIYPNPTNENITISIENFNGNIQTEVYDLIGNRLQTSNETTISLQDYARGIYILKVAYGDKLQDVKVIKQ